MSRKSKNVCIDIPSEYKYHSHWKVWRGYFQDRNAKEHEVSGYRKAKVKLLAVAFYCITFLT